MTTTTSAATDSLALAAACHCKFLDNISNQYERQRALHAETLQNDPGNAAKLAMHSSAMELLAQTSKEFGQPPTLDTPNYSHFLNEIKRLLELRFWNRSMALAMVTNQMISQHPCTEEFHQYKLNVGRETGKAQATHEMSNTYNLTLVPYLHYLQGA